MLTKVWKALPIAAVLLAGAALPSYAAASTLRDGAAAAGRYFGTAVAAGPLSNESQYITVLDREFNSVTAENAMKWDATEPSAGSFSYGSADALVTHAQAHGQQVRGHTLVWHNQTPSWVQNLAAADLRTAMQNHIANVVGHFKGKIYAWDVVNEIFDDNGGFRSSFWSQKLGQTFVADAFTAARAADPAAKLYINDYNVEGVNSKSTAMYNLVRTLKSQGVPIDGVGLQAHLIVGQVPSDLQQNIQRFADLGVDVALTELDIRMQTPSDSTKLANQRTDYNRVTTACLAVTRCVGITVWGFTDKYSWVPDVFSGQGAALPYNENYQAKPAYTGMLDALNGGTGGGGGDTQAPTTPGTPTASTVTSSGATLTWTASTDNTAVTGYDIVNAANTVLGSSTGATTTLTGLTPATSYTLRVIAKDAAGNRSTASASVTFTTTTGGGGGSGACTATYSVVNSWQNGFQAGVTVTNTGTAAITGWTVTWTFPNGQTITQLWNGTLTQSGSAITVRNASYNGALGVGASTTFGFTGTHTGTNNAPSSVTCS
ncbi:endo-1,4-beta-xylanase [Sphaerisporangium corydalis]|uniref:Beta-xylanase n=1 Tax=Sphaerisporangium corydalis TaxID=1441875 RepID=A0ABV9EL39_9ACTN|nr:endo-1,4-beta-xylanase [Sphaerisporangium corydalis]